MTMIMIDGQPYIPVISKLWHFLRTFMQTIMYFDLVLQGTLLIVILLEHTVYLLLNRDASTGYSAPFVADWVLMGVGGAEFLLGALVAWWGRRSRKSTLSAWLAATAAAGLIVLAFPFNKPNPTTVDLCGVDEVSPRSLYTSEPDPLVTPRTIFLIITAVLCALTQVSIWAHGLTYLDDHEPHKGPFFYGFLIAIRVSMVDNSWLRASAVSDDWWVVLLSISMLTLMFAILFILFPQTVKGCEATVEDKEDNGGLLPALRRVLSNKVLVLQIGALGFMNTAVFRFFFYERDYVQARFHIESLREDLRSARVVGNLFTWLVIFLLVMIFREHFSGRRNDGVKANTAARVGGILAVFVAVFFAVLAALECDVSDVAGMETGDFKPPECSLECGCESQRYGFAPVCALNTTTTYFSPCQAGCSQVNDLNGYLVYSGCACAEGLAVRGACALPSCRVVYSLYQLFLSVLLAIGAATLLMQGMVVVRAVARRDKPVAMGVMLAAVALIEHVLGHLLFMLISHLTCAFSDERVCLFHRPTIYIIPAVSAVMAVLSGIVSEFASKLAKKSALAYVH